MFVLEQLRGIVDLGGPVVAILLVLSVVSLTAILWKLWQFTALGVGRHRAIDSSIAAADNGDLELSAERLARSRNHLSETLLPALKGRTRDRVEAAAAGSLDRLERGFRLLDSIAQIAPLLGLFGTVLGMIDAFRELQAAGSSVDPSILAGGIWVALMTTAAGLAVAMPTSLALTFLESRVARERGLADEALAALYAARG